MEYNRAPGQGQRGLQVSHQWPVLHENGVDVHQIRSDFEYYYLKESITVKSWLPQTTCKTDKFSTRFTSLLNKHC